MTTEEFHKKWKLEMQIKVRSKLHIKFDGREEELSIVEAMKLCRKLMIELGVTNINQLIPEPEICHPEKD